jgi:hypothetical protein
MERIIITIDMSDASRGNFRLMTKVIPFCWNSSWYSGEMYPLILAETRELRLLKREIHEKNSSYIGQILRKWC